MLVAVIRVNRTACIGATGLLVFVAFTWRPAHETMHRGVCVRQRNVSEYVHQSCHAMHREWPEGASTLIVDARDWSIIPAENLVAICQGQGRRVVLYASTAEDAKTLLAALEVGVDGVVLRTDSLDEVRVALCPPATRCRLAPGVPAPFSTC